MRFKITDTIEYVGVNDRTIDLFESQYIVPNGVSYNSYIIKDEKTVIMDTVDRRATNEWIGNIEKALQEKEADYIVISHLEPDHSANIELLTTKYPKMKIILNQKAAEMMPHFFDIDLSNRFVIVKEGDVVDLGNHKLQFFMAPMVHWPEVMVTYEQTEKVLFTADGFGKFGTLDTDEEWACEARRYYFNICGKYGAQVQLLLKKVANLNINTICPLHGPILKENLSYYINKYDVWSSYKPEDKGVLIAYNSIHGNTGKAIETLEEILKENGEENIVVSDLARADIAEVIEDAFRYDKLIIATPTYDAGLFPTTELFLRELKHKNYQKRKVGIIQNGSWAPMAAKCIKDILGEMKDINICENIVTIKTRMNDTNISEMNDLVKELLGGE
ncbi:MAG: FprA family A-type flavoprotein [Clostridia bacterium]|nr:FprA family A-type flavoprotein [Clostridia bacterium]